MAGTNRHSCLLLPSSRLPVFTATFRSLWRPCSSSEVEQIVMKSGSANHAIATGISLLPKFQHHLALGSPPRSSTNPSGLPKYADNQVPIFRAPRGPVASIVLIDKPPRRPRRWNFPSVFSSASPVLMAKTPMPKMVLQDPYQDQSPPPGRLGTRGGSQGGLRFRGHLGHEPSSIRGGDQSWLTKLALNERAVNYPTQPDLADAVRKGI